MADRIHPLAAFAAASPDCAAVRLAALPPAVRLVVRRDAAVGMAIPDPCRVTLDGERALLWLGPDEFLLLLPDGASDAPAGAVNISHRDTALSVSGSRAGWVVNAFCPLDLHSSAFPVGMCARTIFGRSAILLWRTDTDTFRIDVARSFAPYVWACLEEARREFL